MESRDIKFNLLNSALAGALVMLGSLTTGFSWNSVYVSLVAGLVVFVTKFKEYLINSKKKREVGIFTFI